VRLSRGVRATSPATPCFRLDSSTPTGSRFEHDPEEAARVRVSLLRELRATAKSLVATHLSFPSGMPCGSRRMCLPLVPGAGVLTLSV